MRRDGKMNSPSEWGVAPHSPSLVSLYHNSKWHLEVFGGLVCWYGLWIGVDYDGVGWLVSGSGRGQDGVIRTKKTIQPQFQKVRGLSKGKCGLKPLETKQTEPLILQENQL